MKRLQESPLKDSINSLKIIDLINQEVEFQKRSKVYNVALKELKKRIADTDSIIPQKLSMDNNTNLKIEIKDWKNDSTKKFAGISFKFLKPNQSGKMISKYVFGSFIFSDSSFEDYEIIVFNLDG